MDIDRINWQYDLLITFEIFMKTATEVEQRLIQISLHQKKKTKNF